MSPSPLSPINVSYLPSVAIAAVTVHVSFTPTEALGSGPICMQCFAGSAKGVQQVTSITPLYCLEVTTKSPGESSVVLNVSGANENSLNGRPLEFVAISERPIAIKISSSISGTSAPANESLFVRIYPTISSMLVRAADDSVEGGRGLIWIIDWLPARQISGISAEIAVGLWYKSGNGSSVRLGVVNFTVHVLPCLTSVKSGEVKNVPHDARHLLHRRRHVVLPLSNHPPCTPNLAVSCDIKRFSQPPSFPEPATPSLFCV